MLIGGLAGLTLDPMVFSLLAFGSLALLPGQLLGKTYGVVLAAAVTGVRQRRRGMSS